MAGVWSLGLLQGRGSAADSSGSAKKSDGAGGENQANEGFPTLVTSGQESSSHL